MKVYIAGLTNGLINVVDSRSGLQVRATTASATVAKALNEAIRQGKFKDSDAVLRQMDRVKSDGSVEKCWALFYQGKLALWLEGTNNRLDASFEDKMYKALARKVAEATDEKQLRDLWIGLAKIYGGSRKGKILGFRPQFNDKVLALFKKRKEEISQAILAQLENLPV